MVAVSYDSVEILRNFADRKNISISLLSDPASDLIRRCGILNESVPKNSPVFGIPHPVTFLVNEKGIIHSRHFEEDYRRRLTIGNILGDPVTVSPAVKNARVEVQASASDANVRSGERIRLFVDLKLPKRMHVYAPGVTGYIPLEWKMDDGVPMEALPVVYPRSRVLHLKAIDERVPVFEGTFRLTREIVIGSAREMEKAVADNGKLTLTGSLRVQACDDKKCYVPEDIPLQWNLHFEPHDSIRVPPELRKQK